MDIKTAYAHALAAATLVAGYVVAFVPSMAPLQQDLVAGGGVVFAGVILLSHAIRNRPAGQTPAMAAEGVAAAVGGQVDFNAIVRKELAKIAGVSPGVGPAAGPPAPATAAAPAIGPGREPLP